MPRPPPESPVYEVKFPPRRVGVGTDAKGVDRLRLIVDSGAHSRCLSRDKLHMVQITNQNPDCRVKVANGALLKVIAIGNLTFGGLEGFKLNEDGTRVPTITSAAWHNMMLVDGLDPQTVLLSVKRMREDDNDNILTYFNSDNAAKVSDCLKLPNGTFVPFNSDNFELYAQPDLELCLLLSHSQHSRTPLHIHAALCHAGRDRVKSSRITIEGQPVKRMPNSELCKGCAHGGTSQEHHQGITSQ